MPPRAAAQKASRLAAAQLESSPPSSDARVLEFGEPSKPRTPVKVTYGRRRRGLSSPTKSSDSSPGKGKNVVKRARPSLSALVSPSGTTGGRAESPIVLSDQEAEGDEGDEPKSPLRGKTSSREAGGSKRVPPAKKPSATVRRKGKSGVASNTSTPAKRKRAISISSTSSLSDLGDSDLTPLSSPSPESTMLPPPTRARSASTLTTLTSSQLSKSAISLRRTHSVATLGESSVADDEPWSLSKLGTLVWVRVDGAGEVVIESGAAYDGDAYWWPAKVINLKEPLKLSLLGDGPRLTDIAERDGLIVNSPSASNILSMLSHRGKVRFSEENYKATIGATTAATSPRKRRKLDIDTRWREARELMLQEDEDANEGLPVLLSSHFSRDASFSVKTQSAGGSKTVEEIILYDNDDSSGPREKRWRPPPCDSSLEIPGELVLAKEKKMYTEYWPAKLLEYIAPVHPRQRPRYKALFYDGIIKNIDADWFISVWDDKNFVKCKLGRDLYNYGLEEDRDDVAAPLHNEASDTGILDDTLRVPTPEPATPPPPPPESFEDLTLAEQFGYVKPVLAAVIEGLFGPANERHDNFMRGAAARRLVCESGYTRGTLRQDEVEELLRLVRRWAARRERRRELGILVGDRSMGLRIEEGSACVESSQAPSADIAVKQTVTPKAQPAESQTEHTISEAEGPPPSQLTVDVDADAHEPPIPGASTAPPLSIARPPRPDGHEVADSPERTALASDPAGGEPHRSEREGSSPPNGRQRPRPKLTFKDLSAIDQITYCQNILLHEAVLQLLLWRSGDRTSPGLLTDEEERRLHEIAFEKANESDWVHEIIRLKQAAEGKMLPWANNDKSNASAAPPASSGSTRTRRKRG